MRSLPLVAPVIGEALAPLASGVAGSEKHEAERTSVEGAFRVPRGFVERGSKRAGEKKVENIATRHSPLTTHRSLRRRRP